MCSSDSLSVKIRTVYHSFLYLLVLLLVSVLTHFLCFLPSQQRCGGPEDFWNFSQINRPRSSKKLYAFLGSGLDLGQCVLCQRTIPIFLTPPNMLPLVETAHSSNMNVMFHGGTINSAQGDLHIHNKDSESGMHNFRSIQKIILIDGQM